MPDQLAGGVMVLGLQLPALFWLAPIAGVSALVMAYVLATSVMKRDEGDDEMRRIAEAVRRGAKAYLFSQYRVVGGVFVVITALLGVLAALGLQPVWATIGVPLAGILSAVCGWFGMRMATNASARTAAACRTSLNDGLTVAFRSGAVMGLTCVGIGILDVSFWLAVFSFFGGQLGIGSDLGAGLGELREISSILILYTMGASLQALFARVGGGIFTKAADVGADLVGKVEAGIPEDDARNPAVIADNVGDNVGDVAGMGADLYESYYSSIIAALSLGVSAAAAIAFTTATDALPVGLALGLLPLVLAAVGIFASVVGVFTIRTKDDAGFEQLLGSLRTGVNVSSALIVVGAFGVPWALFSALSDQAKSDLGVQWWQFSLSIIVGLVSGLVIARWTEFCTSYSHSPTKRIASQAVTGPATVIIAGIAEGMKSTWACLLTVAVAIILAFAASGGQENFLLGLYGVGIAAVGMLATLGITLATDAYGPIADNAGGNAEMSGQKPEVRERTDLLDSIGNTTAATGKGFAIGSAALTAMALLAAYIQMVGLHLESDTRAIARAYGEANPAAVEAAATAPVALYEGHNRFGLILPGPANADGTAGAPVYVGALLADRAQLTAQEHGVESMSDATGGELEVFRVVIPAGQTAKDVADDRLLTVTGDIDHGDHPHRYTFTLVRADRASIDDIVAYSNVSIVSPRLLGGLFLGVMVTFLFCALTMDAVGRAANIMMQECRRQFGKMRAALRGKGMSEQDVANPDNWPKQIEFEGKTYPAYEQCVTIATNGALREMVVPSLLAVLIPVTTGLVLGVPGVMGLLAGGLSSGFAVAVFMANAGGAWDNAKKLLESYGRIPADKWLNEPASRDRVPAHLHEHITNKATELRAAGRGSAYCYGKGSDDHKATVVGDTVGDPFKDTSGPSLNILIKLLSSVSVVSSGLIVAFAPQIGRLLGLE